MTGNGQKSETNKTGNKYTRRYRRLIMLVGMKHAGKRGNGYTDWTKRRLLSDGLQNVTSANAGAKSLPLAHGH